MSEIFERKLDKCEILTAGNGKEALKKILDGFRPDIIFTDFRMPVTGGLTFAYNFKTRIRFKSYRNIPIVVVPSE